MNRIAYTIFIAFIAAVLTVFAVNALTSDQDSGEAGRVISLDELAEHDSTDSCWKAIDGRVYDITSYVPNHPTPEHVIADWCGQESTDAWEGIGGGRGHSATAEAMLRNYAIGVLEGHEDLLDEMPEEAAETPSEPATATQQRREPLPTRPAVTGPLGDGSYYAELEPDGRGWTPLMEITVHAGHIVGVHYDEVQRDEDGNVTDSKLSNYGYSNRWRNAREHDVSALSAFPAYVEQLTQSGAADGVDGISGATDTHRVFVELASQLVERARAAAPQRAPVDLFLVEDLGLTDGSYYEELAPDGRGWIALMEVTVQNGRIVGVHYDEVQRDEDGNVTDRKHGNYGYSSRWRNAIEQDASALSSFPAYERLLTLTGDASLVDGISGATSTHESFTELAQRITSRARQ